MVKLSDREISKEVFDRAQANRGYITESDKQDLFDDSLLYGYGVYSPMAFEKDGKYYCSAYRGETCD